MTAPWLAHTVAIPPIVIALIIGVALNPIAGGAIFEPGITFCIKAVLRCAVALLGLRIALGEIVDLGIGLAVLVMTAMVATIATGLLFTRLLRQGAHFGVLAGVATAVCGASATLATASVLRDYPGKKADIAFTVIAVNALSTVAMVVYPAICTSLGFDQHLSGAMLGGTIHDVAQVVGAGYAVSSETGNTAVIIKLFRVLLLFPVIVAIGWWFAQPAPAIDAMKASIPVFALAFIAFCLINSGAPMVPWIAPKYAAIKDILVPASNWGLLIAIAALGIGTSFSAVASLGWRHVVTLVGTTIAILAVMAAGLHLIQ